VYHVPQGCSQNKKRKNTSAFNFSSPAASSHTTTPGESPGLPLSPLLYGTPKLPPRPNNILIPPPENDIDEPLSILKSLGAQPRGGVTSPQHDSCVTKSQLSHFKSAAMMSAPVPRSLEPGAPPQASEGSEGAAHKAPSLFQASTKESTESQ